MTHSNEPSDSLEWVIRFTGVNQSIHSSKTIIKYTSSTQWITNKHINFYKERESVK